MEAAWTNNPADRTPLSVLRALLKRVALAAFSRDQVASLSGGGWCEFLDRTAGRPLFAGAPAETLRRIGYERDAAQALSCEELTALLTAARTWIRSHDRAAGTAPRTPPEMSG